MLLSQCRCASPDFVGEQELPAGRGGDLGKCQLAGALVGDGEVANLLDGVAEEVDPYGMLFGRREDVDYTAAHCEFAASLHKVDTNVRRVHKGLAQLGEVDLRSDREPYRTKIAETLDLRLQDAADGSDDDLRRRLVGAPGEPAQDGQPATDRVRTRTQSLVWQGLPGRVVRNLLLAGERGQGRRDLLGLAKRGRDQQHRLTGSAAILRRGKRGSDQRAHRRWSRDVQGPKGARACIADGLGDGGVFDQQINKSRKAHRPNLPSVSFR